MQDTAVDLGEAGHDNAYGHGRIDAYKAVRWVLNAGDLQGSIIDANTGQAVTDAIVSGTAHEGQNPFQSPVDLHGHYSITVPAGRYDIAIDAWGYERAVFEEQTVFKGLLSIADFALTPLSMTTVSGRVMDEMGNGIGQAQISVVGNGALDMETDADGSYTLSLPVGTHD